MSWPFVYYMLMTRDARRAFLTIVAAMKLQKAAEKDGDFETTSYALLLGFQLYLGLTSLYICAEFQVIHSQP